MTTPSFRTYGDPMPEGMVYACDIVEQPIVMLPWGRMGLELSVGDLNLFAAHPGNLKSTLACQIAAGVTEQVERNGVLIITEEDAAKATVPRLRLMGADLERVIVMHRPIAPQDLLPLVEHEDLGLIIADPVSSAIYADQNSNDDVRRALEELHQTVMAPHGVTLLGLVHFAKNTQRDTGLGRMMGASAFGQMARQVYVLGRADEDDELHIDVADEKHSYTRRHSTVRHRICPFPNHPGLVYLEELCLVHRTSAEVVANKPSALSDLASWVLDQLNQSPGGVYMTELIRRARDEGKGAKTKVRKVVKALADDHTSPVDIAQDGNRHLVYFQGPP